MTREQQAHKESKATLAPRVRRETLERPDRKGTQDPPVLPGLRAMLGLRDLRGYRVRQDHQVRLVPQVLPVRVDRAARKD